MFWNRKKQKTVNNDTTPPSVNLSAVGTVCGGGGGGAGMSRIFTGTNSLTHISFPALTILHEPSVDQMEYLKISIRPIDNCTCLLYHISMQTYVEYSEFYLAWQGTEEELLEILKERVVQAEYKDKLRIDLNNKTISNVNIVDRSCLTPGAFGYLSLYGFSAKAFCTYLHSLGNSK